MLDDGANTSGSVSKVQVYFVEGCEKEKVLTFETAPEAMFPIAWIGSKVLFKTVISFSLFARYNLKSFSLPLTKLSSESSETISWFDEAEGSRLPVRPRLSLYS